MARPCITKSDLQPLEAWDNECQLFCPVNLWCFNRLHWEMNVATDPDFYLHEQSKSNINFIAICTMLIKLLKKKKRKLKVALQRSLSIAFLWYQERLMLKLGLDCLRTYSSNYVPSENWTKLFDVITLMYFLTLKFLSLNDWDTVKK